MVGAKSKAIWEFGDFQTPPALCDEVCKLLAATGFQPANVVEPTCGRGAFLAAAAATFPKANLTGLEINPQHLAEAKTTLAHVTDRTTLHLENFFVFDWSRVIQDDTASLLIIGNPPWVTSAELGMLGSDNLPQKSNFKGLSGMDAMTGKSNFDISEWMLLRYLEWLNRCGGRIAVLVKTAVARKVLLNAWKGRYPIADAAIYRIDAMRHFSAAVDACLLTLRVEPGKFVADCPVYDSLDAATPDHIMGYHNGLLITDVAGYMECGDLEGPDAHYAWRSGVKHDCSRVMEFVVSGEGNLSNGLGEVVDLEPDFLFPLLKSSDVHNGRTLGHRYMLVPQSTTGESTDHIRTTAPKTWAYLRQHAEHLSARGSSIYRNRPEFSIFGVGPYTFAPWKVAISGFYKALNFSVVGPLNQKPAVFDDTVYFLSAFSEGEARFIHELLSSKTAQSYYGSMVFWEDKRPITVDLLKRLSLRKLAAASGRLDDYRSFAQIVPDDLFSASAA